MTAPSELAHDVLQKAFRGAMAQVATPVSVVTTQTPAGVHGTTVSAVASLSMEPPMMLISLDRRSRLLSSIDIGTVLGVNILASGQEPLASLFAGKDRDGFAGVDWTMRRGAPALADCHAWVALRATRLVEAGDHVIVLSDVIDAETGEGDPLTYWRRTFGTHRS